MLKVVIESIFGIFNQWHPFDFYQILTPTKICSLLVHLLLCNKTLKFCLKQMIAITLQDNTLKKNREIKGDFNIVYGICWDRQ